MPPLPLRTTRDARLHGVLVWPLEEQKPLVAQIEAAASMFGIYDVDENTAMARQYGITATPTYIFYLCGRKPLRTNDATTSW